MRPREHREHGCNDSEFHSAARIDSTLGWGEHSSQGTCELTIVTDDIEAIKRLKARYCRTMDTKDWAAMRTLFADDVVVDTTESGGNVTSGADEFVAGLQIVIGDAITVHQCHTPEIDIASPTAASGIWAMEDMLRFVDGTELHGYGHYHETYEKLDGTWRIKTLKLTRLRTDVTPPAT
jgi:uncharacterized protein (TIGR02246 family)